MTDFADLFLLLERESGADWGERFRRSAAAERYIGTPPPTRAPGPYGVPTPAPTTAPAAPPRQQSALAQFGVLARRYLAVIGADRQYTIFMVALPLLLAALSHALPGRHRACRWPSSCAASRARRRACSWCSSSAPR